EYAAGLRTIELRADVLEGRRHRSQMERDRQALGDGSTLPVKDGRGEIQAVPHDLRNGAICYRHGHFVGDGAKTVEHHLLLEGISISPGPRRICTDHQNLTKHKRSRSSQSATQPGGTTTVASISSTISGPGA